MRELMRINLKVLQCLAAIMLATAAFSVRATPATTYYIYDESGHLIGEYDANGNTVQEHIYLGDRPVAVVQGGNVGYVTADQLNTPRAVTNISQTIEWSWTSDPFGNGQPTGSVMYNLRFPGQYYDAETGHSYNYFRDYDSATGRYMESDPVGIAGGLNTYLYALASPIFKSDIFGLVVAICNRALGGPNEPPLPGNSTWPLRHEYIVVNGQAYSFQPSGSELLSPGQILNNENPNNGQCSVLCADPQFDSAVLNAIGTIGAPSYCLLATYDSLAHAVGMRNCQTWAQDVLNLAKQNYLKNDKCPKCFKGNN